MPAHDLELHAHEPAPLDDEPARRVVLEDLDLLTLGVLELPRAGLEQRTWLTRHHLHVLAADPLGAPAAVHRRVPRADDQHPLADGVDVLESDRLQPIDADVDLVGRVPAARQIEFLAPRCARPDEHGVPALFEHRGHALDRMARAKIHAHVEDHVDLLVQNARRQPELRDVVPHQPPSTLELLVDGHRIAERHEVVGHRERGGPRADQEHPLPVLLLGDAWQEIRDVLVPEIRRDALQPADRDRLFVQAGSSARGLAGAVARSTQDPRKDVRVAIQHVGVGVPAERDEPDVLRHVGVRGACPLAIHDPVVMMGVRDIGRAHGEARGFGRWSRRPDGASR